MKRMILILLLLPACQSADLQSARVARFVDEIVFGGAFDAHLPQNNRVIRWSGEIRLQIAGVTTDELDSLVYRRLQTLSQIAGLPVERAGNIGNPNLTLTFVEDLDFEINHERVPCFARIMDHKDFEIFRAEIYISVVDPDIIEHCIDHELMHVFGFGYHSSILISALSPFHNAERITAWDEVALSTLFDPRIEPGAERGAVSPVIQEIVRERLRAR